ncbi:MAG TPA: hypothetical protein VHZ26_07860 [Caulobacteraceae bacterium]|nr:hypothetical protein [Caulobacteraceae bacterium]
MTETFALTPEHRAEFDRVGVLRLPGFLPSAKVAVMAGALWADLHARYGAEPHDPKTWPARRPSHFQALVRSGAFAGLGTPELHQLGDALLGAGAWTSPKRWGQPLVTFPTGGWDVPHATWHLDLPAGASLETLPAIRIFALLEPVAPRGGGTPYIAGSHRAVIDRARHAKPGEKLRSADMRALLKAEEPWLAELLRPTDGDRVARFMDGWGAMRGFPVRVEEMTGEPGDILIMHPAMFHTVAPNGLDRVRLALVETFYRGGP